MSYRNNDTYKALENIIQAAGVEIVYKDIPDDCIKGECWARTDSEGMRIEMPANDVFDSEEQACAILGHEMGHILTELDSSDDPIESARNEAMCDLVGVYLAKLAEMTACYEAERIFREMDPEAAV